ncbi:hypothetical protein N8T08_005345 [Aspergillus melleus]|uniref:Uncharacterized protein n=1 Tax=Aspergillus melleus TaxID=138277 RepID=A0ACC3B2T8_9EURO|nr:hypothetical protein N8T08_005345 [Aspergillus melleus]
MIPRFDRPLAGSPEPALTVNVISAAMNISNDIFAFPAGNFPFVADYDPLEEFVSFSHSMGLSTDWTLPTELGLAPIIAKEPITEGHRQRLLEEAERAQITGTNFALPSSQSLSRFTNAFFDSFYPHVPVVHIPTFSLDDCDAKVTLAMAALGAQYRHEHRKAVMLFYAAKAILKKEVNEREARALNMKYSSTLTHRAIGWTLDRGNALLVAQKESMRDSLRAWTFQWQRAPESSLDPRNPNGPVTFTSTALLGLAYVRLAFDMPSYKILESRDPQEIAARLLNLPDLPHGPHLLPAMLHATHALSIPVKLGVDFVARSHAFVWSIQHSICGFEFAVFLCKWLYHICDTHATRPLDEHETRSIKWISDIVEEGRTSGDEDLCPEPVYPSNYKYLAFLVVKLWARLIRGNGQWALLGIIGESLDIYADRCREKYISTQA